MREKKICSIYQKSNGQWTLGWYSTNPNLFLKLAFLHGKSQVELIRRARKLGFTHSFLDNAVGTPASLVHRRKVKVWK